jgi:ketosteroid isomerase-like protein
MTGPSEKLVRDYLLAMEERDLPRAQAMLSPDFAMVFPGDIRMNSISAVLEWAAPRYRFVKKTFDHFDDAGTVVFSSGTLHGEWPDGTPFSGIRFIDRFEIADGKLTRQDVWNDMAELRPR